MPEDHTAKAYDMAKKQRDISIAEFFEKNRHLLGFDNKRKALLTTVKEAVDNSLDACEEARIPPEIIVEIIDMQNDRFRVVVEDNGPGIVRDQIPKVFAKLLYGSKFYKLSQSRGQQGIGISAAVLYAQLTTGRPVKITSRVSAKEPAHYYELNIDTRFNKPDVVKEDVLEWHREHGTRVEMDLEATYQKGPQSVDEYLKQTAIINPHVTIIYTSPKAEQMMFQRVTEELPALAKEIKPHPLGVELGMLIKMLANTTARSLQSFLTQEFSRVSYDVAKEICQNAALLPDTRPVNISRPEAEKLMEGIKQTKLRAPPTDCISPLGEELIEKGLRKEINAEFYCAVSRPAGVYRGNPFVIEAGIAYGGELPSDSPATVLRFGNRVPLLYQQGACAITESIVKTNWKPYGLQQSAYSMPTGPVLIMVHMASVWVPFTSEAKEAVAHYNEIISEIKLALQECGRKLSLYVNKKKKVAQQMERANLFENYIPEIVDSLAALSGEQKEKILAGLKKILGKDEIQAELAVEKPEQDDSMKAELRKGDEDE